MSLRGAERRGDPIAYRLRDFNIMFVFYGINELPPVGCPLLLRQLAMTNNKNMFVMLNVVKHPAQVVDCIRQILHYVQNDK